eukprot:symbB.v1.2.025685.t1/scaffold2428.1/size79313/2
MPRAIGALLSKSCLEILFIFINDERVFVPSVASLALGVQAEPSKAPQMFSLEPREASNLLRRAKSEAEAQLCLGDRTCEGAISHGSLEEGQVDREIQPQQELWVEVGEESQHGIAGHSSTEPKKERHDLEGSESEEEMEEEQALEEEVKELKEAAKSNVVSGYTLVEASSSAAPAVGDQLPVATYDYNYLATTIPPVPEDVVRACALLSGGRLTFRQRAERAWAAGHWARFVLEGKLAKPRPTTPIDLANAYYVVLRRGLDLREGSRICLASFAVPMEQQQLMSVEEGFAEVYVVQWPLTPDAPAALAWVVMKRQGGALLALPTGFLSVADLEEQQDPSHPIGASVVLTVPAVQESEGGFMAMGFDMDVLVVDFQADVLEHITPLARSNIPAEAVQAFFVDVETLPDPYVLVAKSKEWVVNLGGDMQGFYSAEEEAALPKPSVMKATPKKAGGERAKRVSAPQQVAESIKSLAELVPGLALQLTAIQEEQAKMRQDFEAQVAKSSLRPSQAPVSMDLQMLGKVMGPPPRTKNMSLSPPLAKKVSCVPRTDTAMPIQEQLEEAEAEAVVEEKVEGNALALAVLEQSRALTSLVSQMQSGDPLLDSQGNSFSTSSKGAQGREKLQAELSSRSGGFMLAMLQNAHRRMRPASPLPSTVAQVAESDFSMVSYLERYGGYGNCRELGIIQFALSYVIDASVRGDLAGVQEHAALLCVALKQACQDQGLHRQGKSFRTTLPPTMGNGIVGFPEGVGLHQQPENRDHKESSAKAGGDGCSTEKEEVSKGKRRRRPRRRCSSQQLSSLVEDYQLLDGYRDDGQVVSSTFGSALSGDGNNMPECGLGGDPLPHGLSYEAQGARQSHGLSGIGGFGSQSGPLSLYALSRRIVKDLLGARAPFSFYVLRCILGQRGIRECPATTALFPIPLPVMDVWSGPRTLGVVRTRRLAQRRLLSLVIMALNYIHSPDPWKTFKILRRRPSKIHLDAHRRLLALVKAGGPSQAFDFLRCGRKSFQLSARLEEIFEALQKLGLSDSSKYHSSSSGASVSVRNDCDELVPYRPLSASRVKLTGQGAWDCSEFLSELFYLPFKEPRINMFDIQPPAGAFPDVRGSTGDEEFALALVWDAKNLLRLYPEDLCPKELSSYTRVFGNYKDADADRQIGDRRGQNFREGRLAGPSKSLPTMTSLLQICVVRYEEVLCGSATDRKDFYHQFYVTDEKASLNCIFPKFDLSRFIACKAYDAYVEKFLKKSKYDRAAQGDMLHGAPSKGPYPADTKVVACFGALFQGDHLGVELATDAHSNLLCGADLLDGASRLRSDFPLALDSKEIYKREGIIGSDAKDVVGALVYKVCGAEVDSSLESVDRGVVFAAAPWDKRMSLALFSAASAALPYTSDALHACLLGSWVSVLMMRRQLFAIMNESFRVVPQDELDTENPVLRPLSRKAAEELLLLACLAPVAGSNLAVPFSDRLFATDASSGKGGIAEAECSHEISKALWLAADRKGSSVPLGSGLSEVLEEYDPLHEVLPTQPKDDAVLRKVGEVDRPLGLRFDFIEICGGSGVVTKELIKRGIVCGPVFDLSFSNAYDLCDLKVVRWLIHLLESDRLKSFLVAPPCTSFSPAAYPSVRSYRQPRGYNQRLPKVHLGNVLAFVALCLLFVALKQKKIGLGEQPRRSKMRWLLEWKRLVALGAVECVVASCAYGSPHQKEFGLIGANIVLDGIARRCTRDHVHIPIQGRYTKPSAVYCAGLAVAFAELFQQHIIDYDLQQRSEDFDISGLESILTNDVSVGLSWKQTASWKWTRSSHINVLEGKAALRLFTRVASSGGDVRLPFLCDSHVARSAIAKGRSPSGALQCLLKTVCATCVGYGLYPAGVFSPTRYNPGDAPTRDLPMPIPFSNMLCAEASPLQLRALAMMRGLRRWICGWIRLNSKLVEYGRLLFDDGKPFYHYCETINALTVARPLIRRSLQQAWDLAFIWGSYEPSEHHVAMPYQILIALISAAWSWGWRREASIFALAWGALLRIGEVLDAYRKDLVLPSDVGFTIDYVLLKICEPKTRYRAARHQAGKLEQIDLIEVVRIGFEELLPNDNFGVCPGRR